MRELEGSKADEKSNRPDRYRILRIHPGRGQLPVFIEFDPHLSRPLFPEIPGMQLEVRDLVLFVNNLKAEDGFNDILKGNKPDGRAELIHDQHDLVSFLNETPEQGIHRRMIGRNCHWTGHFGKGQFILGVLEMRNEHVAANHKTGYLIPI